MISDFKELDVWKRAVELSVDIYRLSSGFPRDEIYGLTSQMRRSAVSIPSNISEGSSRASTKELLHFLSIARGTAAELETQIIIAGRLEYLSETSDVLSQLASVQKMLNALMRSIRSKS